MNIDAPEAKAAQQRTESKTLVFLRFSDFGLVSELGFQGRKLDP